MRQAEHKFGAAIPETSRRTPIREPAHISQAGMIEWNLPDMDLNRDLIEPLQKLEEEYKQLLSDTQKLFGDFLAPNTYSILEKENIPRIVQIRDTSGLEPLTPLEIFGGFNLSKFSDERKDFLMAEYRLFIDRLRTLKTNLETDTPSLPYFTTDQIVLDKDGHIKILSVDFYKKTEDSVHQTQEQIDKIITFIETIMFPLLRAGKQNRI